MCYNNILLHNIFVSIGHGQQDNNNDALRCLGAGPWQLRRRGAGVVPVLIGSVFDHPTPPGGAGKMAGARRDRRYIYDTSTVPPPRPHREPQKIKNASIYYISMIK